MISIKEAKARQAEQANKAAASLLEMLAKEVENNFILPILNIII